MAHWRTFLDSDVIRYVDLNDQEYTLKIAKITRDKVKGKTGKATSKCFIHFEGREKPLAAGAEALSQIGQLYGNDTRKWPGKWITIWPDPNVKYGGERVGGIRIRPVVPKVDSPSGQKEGA